MKEVLCKLIAYNLKVVAHEMFEIGVIPSFAKGYALDFHA